MLGNYGLQRYTTRFASGNERSGILLNYGKQKSDGFSIHNASHKDFANAVFMSQPNEKQSISTYIGFTDSYDERLGELTITQWANKDYSGNPDYIKRDGHSHVITYRAGVTHTLITLPKDLPTLLLYLVPVSEVMQAVLEDGPIKPLSIMVSALHSMQRSRYPIRLY